MAREGDAAHQAIEADVDARECRQFREQGCRVESPPCMAPPAPVCSEGKCG
jgi:hypothetical protein